MKNQDIAKNLEKLLDRHGYSFQYRVVKEADTLRKKDLSAWRLEGTEIPVGAGTDITHVDMVFSTN